MLALRRNRPSVDGGMSMLPSSEGHPGETQQSRVARYAEQYKTGLVSIESPDRRRMVILTAAFTPMVAVGALPITAVTATIASIIADVTARWIGLVILIATQIALGFAAARLAANYQ